MHLAFSLPLLLRMGFVRKQCDQRQCGTCRESIRSSTEFSLLCRNNFQRLYILQSLTHVYCIVNLDTGLTLELAPQIYSIYPENMERQKSGAIRGCIFDVVVWYILHILSYLAAVSPLWYFGMEITFLLASTVIECPNSCADHLPAKWHK